jgi:hypothetical protein
MGAMIKRKQFLALRIGDKASYCNRQRKAVQKR